MRVVRHLRYGELIQTILSGEQHSPDVSGQQTGCPQKELSSSAGTPEEWEAESLLQF